MPARRKRSLETSRRQSAFQIAGSGAGLAMINSLGGRHRHMVGMTRIILIPFSL